MTQPCPAEDPDDAAALEECGDLAGALAHAVNNFLNNLVLNLAMLEYEAPSSLAAGLTKVSGQALRVAELIREFQQSRSGKSAVLESIDVAEALRGAAEAAAREGGEARGRRVGDPAGDAAPVAVEVPAGLPAVVSRKADLARLLKFLLGNAAGAAAHAGDRAGVRVDAPDSGVRVVIEVPGPEVSDEVLANLFEATGETVPGMSALRLAACQSIVRRLGGNLRAETLSGRGLSIVLELPLKVSP